MRASIWPTAAVVSVVGLTGSLLGCASTPPQPGATSSAPPTGAPVVVQVHAAGSLRDAFSAVAADHQARTGQPVKLVFGPSGLLRERLEKGEASHVFASADTDHPTRLARQGGWQAPVVFVRNSLCALAQAEVPLTPANLLATVLKPDVRLGISTPKADPSGDYAWALFAKAEGVQAGSRALLEAKALQLTGGPSSPTPPGGRNAYAWVMSERRADVFLTYCTNAVAAKKEMPGLQVVAIPAALSVGAAYGLTVRQDAPPAAQAFARGLLEGPAQRVFLQLGFQAP